MRRRLVVLLVALLALALPAAAATRGGDVVRRVAPAPSPAGVAGALPTGPNVTVGVFVHAADAGRARAVATEAGLRVVDVFERIGVAVAVGPAAAARRAAELPGVERVEPDRTLRWATETSHTATRGTLARAGFVVGGASSPGVDGRGVSIAVIDSGVDSTHPMFQVDSDGDGAADRSKVVRNLKLVCAALAACTGGIGEPRGQFFVDAGKDSDTPSAGGHGTHVASTAAGVPVRTASGEVLSGAAPGASVVALSVGAAISVYGGAAAMNWVLAHHAQPCGPTVPADVCPPIRVINNSWGGGGGEYEPGTVLAKLQDALVADGVVVVWAAGNSGGRGDTIETEPEGNSPTPGILSVAAYDDGNRGTREGAIADFSSRGHRNHPATYPDLAAPGVDILAGCRRTMALCARVGGDPDHSSMSGTSMAAPHVAGIVAQVLQANPALSPAEVELLLVDSAHRFGRGAGYERDARNSASRTPTSFDKGHGLVDAAAAVAAARGVPAPAGGECPPSQRPVLDPVEDEQAFRDGAATDIVTGHLHWDAAGRAAGLAIVVRDLKPTSTGWFAFQFTHAGARYSAEARRDQRATTFRLKDAEGTVLADLQGAFRPDDDTVAVIVPSAVLEALGQPPLTQGTVLSDLRITSYESFVAFGLGADTGVGCAGVLGTGAATEPATVADPPVLAGTATLGRGQAFVSTGAPERPELSNDCGLAGASCFTYRVDIEGGFLVAAVDAFALADYDVLVYGADGQLVAQSENAGTIAEETTVDAAAGTYYVVVRPWAATPDTPYRLVVDLRSHP